MKLDLPTAGLEHYKSASQRARVATEAWGERNLYCPSCDSEKLLRAPTNTPTVDYLCPQCDSPFQLKSQSRPFAARIMDAAFEAMRRAIESDKTPNLLALRYEPQRWRVADLLLVPHFAFSLSVLERRKPLKVTARRAGWVGCNIVLSSIPADARIPLVKDGAPISPAEVRHQFSRLRPLAKWNHEKRGWTLDVLNAVRCLGKREFFLADVYSLEEGLARLHPANRYIRDKIRQQLQILRDLGFLEFLGSGSYRLR